MAKFRATVRLTGLEGPDPSNVQSLLDERFSDAGLPKWRVLSIEVEGAPKSTRFRGHRAPEYRRRSEAWGLFLIALGAWAVWFFWLMLD